MNGRVYDPVLGRFLSADPNVDDATDAQGFNRYSYVGNNPMNATDPSGYFSLKDAFKIAAIIVVGIITAGAAIYAAVGLAGGSIGFGAAIAAVVTGGLGPLGVIIAGAAGGFGSAFAGSLLNGGSIGDAFRAGAMGALIGGVTAGLTYGVGSLGQANDWNWFERGLAHGAVQGGVTEATGGQFRHGFYAGFAAGASEQAVKGWAGDSVSKGVTAAAVVGGTAAAVGGGKFANGAVSGAFTYLFNQVAHEETYAFTGKDVFLRNTPPPSDALGWVESDGTGNLVAKISDRVKDPIVRDGIIAHEQSHIEDAYSANPNIAMDPATKGYVLAFSPRGKIYTELKAYLAEAAYLKNQLANGGSLPDASYTAVNDRYRSLYDPGAGPIRLIRNTLADPSRLARYLKSPYLYSW